MSSFDALRLLHPIGLLALLLIGGAFWWRSRKKTGFLIVPHVASWYRPSPVSMSGLGLVLWIAGLSLLVIGLARPQRVEDKREVKQKGYDLFLVMDLSASMLAEDYQRGLSRMNRWEAVLPVIKAFIQKRDQDRIGMVVFSGKAYTLAPLTMDHLWLDRQLLKLKPGILDQGTAIGDGLALALTRLSQAGRHENEERKGAFVILLTDGSNNRGKMEPLSAAEIAEGMKVPVYTIGAGTDGVAPMPVFDQEGNKVGYQNMPADLDEPMLKKIAAKTGGQFYRAADSMAVSASFESIDKAQKIEFQAKSYVLATELFASWTASGLLFCLLGWIAMDRPALKRREKGVV
jgi:Ca-activated chloride channel family protein